MVTLPLGGQTRTLRYPFTAIVRCRTEHGVNLLKLSEADFTEPATVVAILWAGLLHESPDLTVEQVGSWFGFADIPSLSEKVALALQEHLAGNGGPPMAARTTTFTGPSPSPASRPIALAIDPGSSTDSPPPSS